MFYQIVTPFPELLNYSLFAPFVLRFFLGIYLLAFGFSGKRKFASELPVEKTAHVGVRILLVVLGITLIMGVGTQIGALISAIILGVALFRKEWIVGRHHGEVEEVGRSELLLLIIIALTLIITGAGPFAIDLPL